MFGGPSRLETIEEPRAMSQRGVDGLEFPQVGSTIHLNLSNSMDGNDRLYPPPVHNNNGNNSNNMYLQHQASPKAAYLQHQASPKAAYNYRGLPPTYHSRRPNRPYRSSTFTPPIRGAPQHHSRLQSVVTHSFSLDDDREDIGIPRGYYNQRAPDDDRHPTEPMRQLEEREINHRELNSREISREMNQRDMNLRELNPRDMNASQMSPREMNQRDMNPRDMNQRDVNSRVTNQRDLNSMDMNSRDMNSRDMNSRDMNQRQMSPREMNQREMHQREMQKFNQEGPAPPHPFDGRGIPNNISKPIRIPPSPGDSMQEDSPSISGSNQNSPEVVPVLKRSFWHHARATDGNMHPHPQSMHPAFVPPKRAKLGRARKEREVVMIPRNPSEIGEYGRVNSWPSSDDERHRYMQQPPSSWHARHSSPYNYHSDELDEFQYSRSWSMEEGPNHNTSRNGAFRSIARGHTRPYHNTNNNISPQGSFPPPMRQPMPINQHWASAGRIDSYEWSPSSDHWQRDDIESLRARTFSREMSWDDRDLNRQVKFEPNIPFRRYDHYNMAHKMGSIDPMVPQVNQPPQSILRRNNMADDIHQSSMLRTGPLRLLGQAEDRISLSETLCTIRENIEVFTATKADVEAPAPGRKHPVVVGQVGLRCIHCRHTTKSSDRVKRAVCYPSSIKRIYRTVIDMKLDHFAHCRFVPKRLKDRLIELKAINTRSTGTTMQYFVRAAGKMGMVDATTGSGVRLVGTKAEGDEEPEKPTSNKRANLQDNPGDAKKSKNSVSSSKLPGKETSPAKDRNMEVKSEKQVTTDSEKSDKESPTVKSEDDSKEGEQELHMGKVVLALPEDKMALSPLRCFLRENVFAFTASEEDIAVRTPTTFSVVVGQVGIGCIHCFSLPAKERSNRAVCFPFAINRIYQSVADIQRFHLSECKMVPPKIRERFQSLQSASSKGSKGLATRQYWVTSAKKIGLVDTKKGIRFGRDPSVPATQAVSLDILAQVASNVTTVNRPLVLPEDKPFIAEFLYTVMEQLQPCRFTEADRNKRRLKDVGCIGVECKHCAGQVESRKFFWSSVNAVESNFVSVHTHMMECKMITPELKKQLSELKKLRKEQTSRLKTGSQKAFFQRVWERLHKEEEEDSKEETKENDSASEKSSEKPGKKSGDKADEKPKAKIASSAGSTSSHAEKVSKDIEKKMAVIKV